MKLVIASDIHGAADWCERLMAAIEAESPDRVILLGDLLYHGPRNDLPADYAPKRVIEMLNSIADQVIAVRGNCEAEVDQMVLGFPCMADHNVLVDPSAGNKTLFFTHGHVYGDAVLRTVSASIREALPVGTLSGRFGGDEFVLCLTHATGGTGAIDCAQALQRAIRRDVILPGRAGALTVSIGVCAEAGLTYDDMLLRADRAAYRAKQRGKNQCCTSGE